MCVNEWNLKIEIKFILCIKIFTNFTKTLALTQTFILLIHKKFLNTFFSLFNRSLDGISHGFKITLYIKGKGLRIQLKTRKNKLCIYLKLGIVIKFFYIYPLIVGPKFLVDDDLLFIFNKLYYFKKFSFKNSYYYPIGLYKIRGFYIENEKIKIIQGKSRLGSTDIMVKINKS